MRQPIFNGKSLLLLLSAFASMTASANETPDWVWQASLLYSSRTLDGTIVRKTEIANGVFGDLMATGDSMDLDHSNEFIYSVAGQYGKWRVGLNYLPTSYSGDGYAIVSLGGSQTGVLQKTRLATDINVDMVLASLTYDLIQTSSSRFGVGVGAGRTQIDLNIIPRIGNSIIYEGHQPFGFVSVYMANRYRNFLYGFNVNAISATFTGVHVNYSDYNLQLGYRLSDDDIKWDIVGGYRRVNFSIDLEFERDVVEADTNMTGPYIGIAATF
ncbi:hypothetical protein [Pseudomaricurvus sp. HS19]|uniref:hypothetical protein n=1 Tax=Pseudomaricurvus sp. HS19 TaxID=2692626 RepID=UPI001371718E|nr:hypothetical protein [Pseudomaricurvus sp. HS19]MYM63904.1 hypothetical protein [Pseudomaricurvus sp. HS19]